MSETPGRTLKEIAAIVGGHVVVDRAVSISGAAGIESAGPCDISFYEGSQFLAALQSSSAGAVLVREPVEGVAAAQIQVDGRPYLKFIELIHTLHPPGRPPAGVHPSAVVAPDASLGPNVVVGPLAVIKPGARIGARTIVGSQAYVGPGAEMGEDCHLFPRAVVRGACRLGNRVLVHCGAVLGDDGFGYVRDGDRHVKIPHLGRVVIGDDVEIGSNTTIDRATFGETVIGPGTKIDNQVQIAHNVKVGARCILVSQVGIAGSSTVGDDSILAGQVGIARGVNVGNRVIIASKSGVPGTVRDGEVVAGYPAGSHRLWRRAVAGFWRLPEILTRLRRIEQKLGIDEKSAAK
jgi:UDP-3-O-[3-hydroxymyristoyl] glucosamine N-acyltransferase